MLYEAKARRKKVRKSHFFHLFFAFGALKRNLDLTSHLIAWGVWLGEVESKLEANVRGKISTIGQTPKSSDCTVIDPKGIEGHNQRIRHVLLLLCCPGIVQQAAGQALTDGPDGIVCRVGLDRQVHWFLN